MLLASVAPRAVNGVFRCQWRASVDAIVRITRYRDIRRHLTASREDRAHAPSPWRSGHCWNAS